MALKDTLATNARNPTGEAGIGIKNDFATVADAVDENKNDLATHEGAVNPHSQYALGSVTITGGSGVSGGGDLTANRVLDLDINGLPTQGTPTGGQDYLAIYDGGLAANRRVLLDNMPYLQDSDVDDVPVNGATTAPISSNWAFDHDADPKHIPVAGSAGQYIRKQSGTNYDVLWENLKVADDPAPMLGGQLDTDNNEIVISNAADAIQGGIGVNPNDAAAVYFAHVTATGYDPADGGILAAPGKVGLHGSVVEVPSLVGAESRNVQVSEEGILYAAPLPATGWEVSDTSTFDYSFGNGSTVTAWVEVGGLEINPVADVDVGDRVDIFVSLYVENTEDKSGTLDIGIGINSADPIAVGASVSVGPETLTYIPLSWSTTTHGGLTTSDRIDVFVRRGVSVDDATLHLRGTTSEHEMLVSVPSGSGGGGSPTDLGNVPAPSSVTITSSTGANTVVAGAVSGTAGMMTGAQVDTLASALQPDGVIKESLNVETTSGDITLDLNVGMTQRLTLGGNHQITMPAGPGAFGQVFQLFIDCAGNTPIWASSPVIKWLTSDQAAPTLETTSGAVNVIVFTWDDVYNSGAGAWLGQYAEYAEAP